MKVIRTNHSITARAVSLLWWKRIYTGVYFEGLHMDERLAVLAHEKSHCDRHHTEVRLLMLLFFPFSLLFIQSVCHKQELDADTDAAMSGCAKGLMKFILRSDNEGYYHPSNELRIMNIKKHECFRPNPVKVHSLSA